MTVNDNARGDISLAQQNIPTNASCRRIRETTPACSRNSFATVLGHSKPTTIPRSNRYHNVTTRMKLTLAFLLFVMVAEAFTIGPSVTVKDLRLFYGETEYFIKGVAYSPSPLAKIIEGQLNGTGLCTPRKTFVLGSFTQTQIVSPCNYDDYFDGSIYPGGPSGGWFNGLWARDFPVLQRMGVNTIRLYRTWPVTQLSIDSDPLYVDKSVVGTNHIPFLDMAQQYGLKVLFPLLADQALLDSFSASQIQYYIRVFIDEVGYHPAILMYSFGNELQFTSRDDSFISKVNSYIDYARQYQVQKWGRYLPITTGLLDFVDSYNHLTAALDIDIMMLNAGYRGFDFSGLWAQFRYLTCQYQKPILIGEMGVHQDTKQFDVSSWFPTMWSDIINHKNFGATGGFLFEWQEEHWKGVASYGQDYTQFPDVYMGAVSLTPGSGQFPVDFIQMKTGGAYDYNGLVTGFSQNVYRLDGPNQRSTVTNNFCDGSYVDPTGGNQPPTAQCGVGSVACGQACIDPKSSIYCCVAGYILQQAQCPPSAFLANPNGFFAGSRGGSPFPTDGSSVGTTNGGSGNGGSSTTKSSTSQIVSSTIGGTGTTPQNPSTTTSSSSGSSTTTGNGGGACYNPNQYCCPNGNLVQIQFCSTSTATTSSPAPTTRSSSSTTRSSITMPSSSSTTTSTPSTTTSAPSTTCQTMFANLNCRTASEDPSQVSASGVTNAYNWLCSTYPQYCTDITTGGTYAGCNSVERISNAMNRYYQVYGPSQDACSFGGIGIVVTSIPSRSSTTTTPTSVVPATSSSPSTTRIVSSTVSMTTSLPASSTSTATAPRCTTNTCGASSCCPDKRNGNLCYSPSNYSCVVDRSNGSPYLCGLGSMSCNGACFDPNGYKCINGNIVQA
ncbi:hypothetical protein PROFUN_07503 [Planoprotostelium fungivorum]|uniref:X8 domain-containing protein n=1 Tax=Planoprotostelium fungivorum TaxID=1890364 RepID=A0A2P6NLP2_9EUKA|nr:hypothetical protein PROFUN_07503 [Planoprotostelium fungivorum]